MTVWICSGIVIFFTIMFICSLSYRANERKCIDKEAHKLWFLYGMSMFLADKPLRGIVTKNTRRLDEKFKNLYVKEKVETEKYLYVISKLALVIIIAYLSAVIGIVSHVTTGNSGKKISELIRREYGDGDVTYVLEAKDGTEKEQIEIDVPQIDITDEEALAILEQYKEELIEIVLGDNESQDKVTKPLKLPDAIGKENIRVSWEIENDRIIGYDGSLGTDIEKEGTVTRLYATLSLKKISVVHEIVLHVYPPEDKQNLQEIVQKLVNDYDVLAKKIPLPKSVEGKKIIFAEKEEDVSLFILIIGIIAAIAIFILKDKDMDKDIEERNSQMILDYPEVINKIMLLNRAGMSMRKAWERTIESAGVKKSHYVYREMKMALMKINGGIPEMTAYEQFGKRCGVHCYIRFSNIICQNLRRGSGEICRALEYELQSALQEKKNNALKLGEKVGTKLLAPMIIMLIIGLALIVVPAFMSVEF